MSSVRPFIKPSPPVVKLLLQEYLEINDLEQWDTIEGQVINLAKKTAFEVKKAINTGSHLAYQTFNYLSDTASSYLKPWLAGGQSANIKDESKRIEPRFKDMKTKRTELCQKIAQDYKEVINLKGLIEFIYKLRLAGREAQTKKKNPNVDSFFLKTAYAICAFIIDEIKKHPHSEIAIQFNAYTNSLIDQKNTNQNDFNHKKKSIEDFNKTNANLLIQLADLGHEESIRHCLANNLFSEFQFHYEKATDEYPIILQDKYHLILHKQIIRPFRQTMGFLEEFEFSDFIRRAEIVFGYPLSPVNTSAIQEGIRALTLSSNKQELADEIPLAKETPHLPRKSSADSTQSEDSAVEITPSPSANSFLQPSSSSPYSQANSCPEGDGEIESLDLLPRSNSYGPGRPGT